MTEDEMITIVVISVSNCYNNKDHNHNFNILGRDGRVVKVVKVPPRSLVEQLGGRKGPRTFRGGAADWM